MASSTSNRAKTIRLATASPGTRATTRETLAQLRGIAERASAGGADLLLLPEAYLGGYPRGADFGCRVGARDPAGRDAFLDYFRAAVDLGDVVGDSCAGAGNAWVRRELPAPPSSSAEGEGAEEGKKKAVRGDGTREEIESIARDTGVFIVTGLIEKVGGSLYCAAGYVCPRLGFIGKRRKVMPTGSERLIWAQGSAATLKAVTTTIRGVRINMGAAICWENYMPLLRQALYAQNVNLWLTPTADGRDAWLALLRTVALEGRCFVVSSNMCVRREGLEASAGAGAGAAGDHAVEDEDEEDGAVADASPLDPRRRRNSCLTEEGFEIALPTAADAAAAQENGGEAETEGGDEGGVYVSFPQSQNNRAGAKNGDMGNIKKEKKQSRDGMVVNEAFVSRGGSAIVGPDGAVLAGPQWEDDYGVVYADVDFDDCIRGRLDLDAAGSYSRNDAFKFSVEGLDLDPLPYE